MFTVIYSFHVKANQENEFRLAWKELTKLIYQYEGSLGSRLHKRNAREYLAYAQWPDKVSWEQSGKRLPAEAEKIRQSMRTACDHIETSYELEVVDDLLKEIPHP